MNTSPPSRLNNWFAKVIFSSRTKTLIVATHKRFITPKANRRTINYMDWGMRHKDVGMEMVVYLCQAFSQPTSPGRLWISLGAILLLVPIWGGKRPPRTQEQRYSVNY